MERDKIFGASNTVAAQRPRIDSLETHLKSETSIYIGFKRAFDILGSLILIMFFGPLMLILAGLVRLDGAPALYGQQRLGQGGRHFTLWKLRSMVPDAEDRLAQLIKTDTQAGIEWTLTQKLRRDPRVTLIGRFMRKYSLDELPQVFNVLRGEMSLVGPRPMMVEQEELYLGPVYAGLRPGLTGLWQISKRDDNAFAARVGFDAAYAANLSFWTDLKILLATVGYMFSGRGC